jgi:four helix bundle protein
MPTKSLEQLNVFKLSKQLNRDAYPVISQIRDFSYRDQLTRSCLSVPSNIAEGYGRLTRPAFRLFLTYSLGSLYEFQCQVELARDNGLLKPVQSGSLMERCDELTPQLMALIQSYNP